MKSNYKKLGNYIRLVDNRNTDSSVNNLLGINISKNFMPSVANVSQTDLSKYKVIKKGQFAYSAMQTGRDETIRVVLYTDEEPAIISPAYLVFEVNDVEEVLPEFLMMWFKRSESDRYGWFISDSSVRASLEWDRFCEIELPIPDIKEQRKYVALYKSTLAMQKSHENSIDDLRLICDSFIETLKKTEELKPLGDYIEPSDERNTDLEVTHLRGISTSKKFIESKANTTGVNFEKYKIVRRGQFAYVQDTSRRGEKIGLAFNDKKPCIISSIYTVFQVKDTTTLLPEFLFLWFKREDFDRYARFNSWGSARETFDWVEMCRVELPIPDIKVQESIVAIHHALKKRRNISEKLKEMIQELCPVLMSGVVHSEKMLASK